MALWMNTIGNEKLPPLIALMHEGLLAEPVMHCDETTVQVLKNQKAVSSDRQRGSLLAGDHMPRERHQRTCVLHAPVRATSVRSHSCGS